MPQPSLRLGIDFGTSGARAIVTDLQNQSIAQARVQYISQNISQTPTAWRSALTELLEQLPPEICQNLASIAIDGTSSTVMICDKLGEPLLDALMYDDDRALEMLDQVREVAPKHHTVISATSSFAKLLWFAQQPEFNQAKYLLHQADWLAFLLHGKLGISDYHNALKLGYDVERLIYPDWLEQHELRSLLPTVRTPGEPIGPILNAWCKQFGIPSDCQIHAGTTDSIAAFLASGASEIGDAVTSLGSTLVIKLLSAVRLEDTRYGIYSHRLGNRWLVGGASNTGGAVLRSFFTDAELRDLTPQLNPQNPTGLIYYPLTKPGDRFPINDPKLEPCLSPRPDDPALFLQGMLEGMARIEAEAFALLTQLGASEVQQIYTAGGGAQNEKWSEIRERTIGKPLVTAIETEAAYGVTRLIDL
jgi:D-ribulokinase